MTLSEGDVHSPPERVLYVASEAFPLVKTGGLADVAGALPAALAELGCDVRLLLPAYRSALGRLEDVRELTRLPLAAPAPVRLLEGRLPGTRVPVWLLDSPADFDRDGGPYGPDPASDWPDNAARFARLARAACLIAEGGAGLDWRPDVVHCNDWQTGLVPALLPAGETRPATIFTIHNLAYQGLYPWETFQELQLPEALWSMHGLEFHGQLSFIKGGLAFADMLNTVSPRYAHEITTAAFGHGLQDLLAHRADRLVGILNGADYRHWDPATDPHLRQRYTRGRLSDKLPNKTALQAELGLPINPLVPLLGMIGRLVWQKGFDLVLDMLPELFAAHPAQLVVLGSGAPELEHRLREAVATWPGRVAAHIGYDEALAHRIEGAADVFLMPSRFEPCGLNQIYSLRYGTLPVVRRTGGLADTVVDATPEAVEAGTATGFVFDEPRPDALLGAVRRALAARRDRGRWETLQANAMAQDFSWQRSALAYRRLYGQARAERKKNRLDRL